MKLENITVHIKNSTVCKKICKIWELQVIMVIYRNNINQRKRLFLMSTIIIFENEQIIKIKDYDILRICKQPVSLTGH
ncbi:MAG: hypothetical protein APF77_01760 [Clostridia bacterium BRH_c25]|nr:MAG: hypothetical protein APF77_01760 [Clostridia bacterium BRH_c25]